MKAQLHTPMLIAALAATALTAYSSQATTLISNTFGQRSFWDPSVWLPAQTPGPGDTVRIGNVTPELFLGDFAAFPAQSGQISRIHFDATFMQQTLHWESKLTGGQSGGLSFSQDDPADFGVGIRIGRTSEPSGNQVIFINAENSQAEAMNIHIGGGPFSDGGSRDGLQLFGAATNFYADNVILDSFGRTQLLIGGTKLVVNRLTVATAIDGQVLVAGGTLTATEASLTNSSPGTSQVPLVVGNGSSATIDTLTFQAIGLGSESTIQIGSTVPAFGGGGTASFGNVSAFATGGGTAKFVVDGGDGMSSLGITRLNGTASGGTLELRAINGGHLAIAQANLYNDSPTTPGQLNILVDGAGSQLIGGAGSKLFPGTIDVVHGSATLDFSNGGACVDCELHVGSAGDARISGDSTIDFTRIKMSGRDTLLSSGPANATITKSLKTSGAPDVITGSVNVDSDFVLHDDGSKLGGDLSFIPGPPGPPGPPVPAPPPTAGSHLTLELGSRLRIGGVPVLNEVPFLAIGKLGEVTLDATSSVFIGDPLATPSYVPGKITLATGGSIYGNGVINGIGFPSDTHPTVLNTGGRLHPGFSPGKLTIDGQYIQQDGELELEIGGSNAGEYDVLDASQGAQFLGGTIRIVLLNNFVAVNGTRFDFFGSSGLNFFDPSLSIIDETGLGLVFNFSTGAATIGAPVPLPPTAPLFALGCFGLLGIGWRRQHGRVLAANSRVPD